MQPETRHSVKFNHRAKGNSPPSEALHKSAFPWVNVLVVAPALMILGAFLNDHLTGIRSQRSEAVAKEATDADTFAEHLKDARELRKVVKVSTVTCTRTGEELPMMSSYQRRELDAHCQACLEIQKRTAVGNPGEWLEIASLLTTCGQLDQAKEAIRYAAMKDESKANQSECDLVMAAALGAQLDFDSAVQKLSEAETKNDDPENKISEGQKKLNHLRILEGKAEIAVFQNPSARSWPELDSAIAYSKSLPPTSAVEIVRGHLASMLEHPWQNQELDETSIAIKQGRRQYDRPVTVPEPSN